MNQLTIAFDENNPSIEIMVKGLDGIHGEYLKVSFEALGGDGGVRINLHGEPLCEIVDGGLKVIPGKDVWRATFKAIADFCKDQFEPGEQ